MATKAVVLYDEDFYAWTQQQAQALREHFKGDNRLDVGHLAEEIEDPGRSELQAVESFVEQIIAHLQLDYAAQAGPRAHWRTEVLNFRMRPPPQDVALDPSQGRGQYRGELCAAHVRSQLWVPWCTSLI